MAPASSYRFGDELSVRRRGHVRRWERGPVIYIDRSDVHEGCSDDLKAGNRDLVAFIDSHQPQIVTYGFYFDEFVRRMTVVAMHPDSASLVRHVDIGGPQFKKLASFIELREIEVFGRLDERAVELLQAKAAALGDRGIVTMHDRFLSFDRIVVARQP